MRTPIRPILNLSGMLQQWDGLVDAPMNPPASVSEVVGLGALKACSSVLPAPLTSWFGWHNGQPPAAHDAAPLNAESPWRPLAVDEVVQAAAEIPDNWAHMVVPLFADGDQWIHYEIDSHALVRLDENGFMTRVCRSLADWVCDVLEAHGWDVTAQNRPLPDGKTLGRLLSDLDAAVAGSDSETAIHGLRPGVGSQELQRLSDEILGGEPPPAELTIWFSWHDGQAPGEEEGWGVGLHPGLSVFAIPLSDAILAHKQLADMDLPRPWCNSWFPLLTDEDCYVVYELAGPRAGRLVWVNPYNAETGTDMGSLGDWVREALAVRRRCVETENRAAPAGYTQGVTTVQRNHLALASILLERNGERHDMLGGAVRFSDPAPTVRGLRRWWGIVDREDLLAEIERLFVWNEIRRERAGVEEHASDDGETAAAGGPRSADELAWNLGRATHLAGQGYVTGLIDADVAWAVFLRAGRMARDAFESWEDFGQGYANRYAEWAEDEEWSENEVIQTVARLLAPGGAWHDLDWDFGGSGPPPPPPVPDLREVAATPETLRAVLDAATDGDRLLLAPGVYRQPLRLVQSVELVATGPGVVLEPDGEYDAVVTVVLGAVRIEGARIVARGPDRGGPRDAVRVKSGFVQLVDCVVDAAHTAVEAFREDAVHLRGCEILGRGHIGVLINDKAMASLVDCDLHSATWAGVQVDSDASVVIRRCKLRDSEGHGLTAFGADRVLLSDCTLTGLGLAAIGVGGGHLEARRCEISKNSGHGVQLSGAQRCNFIECSISENVLANIYVDGVDSALFDRCEIRGGEATGVWLTPGWGVVLADCQIEGSRLAPVVIERDPDVEEEEVDEEVHEEGGDGEQSEGRQVTMLTCVVRARQGGGALLVNGATARVHAQDCTLWSKDSATVEVAFGGHAELVTSAVSGGGGGVVVHSESTTYLDRTKVSHCAEFGVLVKQASTLRAEDITLSACERAALAVGEQAAAFVHRSRIHDTPAQAALADTGAQLLLNDCTLENLGEEAVLAASGASVVLRGCILRHIDDVGVRMVDAAVLALQSEVVATKAAFGVFGDSRFDGLGVKVNQTSFAGVEAGDRARVTVGESVLAGTGESAVFAHDDARVTLIDTELRPASSDVEPIETEGGAQVERRKGRVLPETAHQLRTVARPYGEWLVTSAWDVETGRLLVRGCIAFFAPHLKQVIQFPDDESQESTDALCAFSTEPEALEVLRGLLAEALADPRFARWCTQAG